MYISIWTGYR